MNKNKYWDYELNGIFIINDQEHRAKVQWTIDLAESLVYYEVDYLGEMFRELLKLFYERFPCIDMTDIGFCLES